MKTKRIMTRADWNRLYATQRPPCNAMSGDPSRSLCGYRAGHDGLHNTQPDGSGRAFAACTQCGRAMNPVEAMLGPVCGKCVRKNHMAVAG